MMGALRLLVFAVAMSGVMGGGTASADSSALKAFFGTYAGESLMPSVELLPRDLRVSIAPAPADGFTIEWQTTLFKFREAQRRKSQLLEFRPTADNPSMYYVVPPDGTVGAGGGPEPTVGTLGGAPYAWAYVQGRLMTIHIMTIIDRGGYVIQTYERRLTRSGMSLSFVRVQNGTVEQRLSGRLNRVNR